MKLRSSLLTLALAFILCVAGGCSGPSTYQRTVPAGGTPVTKMSQLRGAWISGLAQSFWSGTKRVIRFNGDGTGIMVDHANFSSTNVPVDHWTTTTAFTYRQGPDTVHLNLQQRRTLSGNGRGGELKPDLPLWFQNGGLSVGYTSDWASFRRMPKLDSTDLVGYAMSGQLNQERGTGTSFYQTTNTIGQVAQVLSTAAGVADGAGSFPTMSSLSSLGSGASTGGGATSPGRYGVSTVSTQSKQAIQQAYGPSGIAMDIQINRGTDIVKVYGMSQDVARQLLNQARMITVEGSNVNQVLRTFRVQPGVSYKVGIEKVR